MVNVIFWGAGHIEWYMPLQSWIGFCERGSDGRFHGCKGVVNRGSGVGGAGVCNLVSGWLDGTWSSTGFERFFVLWIGSLGTSTDPSGFESLGAPVLPLLVATAEVLLVSKHDRSELLSDFCLNSGRSNGIMASTSLLGGDVEVLDGNRDCGRFNEVLVRVVSYEDFTDATRILRVHAAVPDV